MSNEDRPATSVTDAIRSRHSCRAFLSRPVALDVVRGLLDTARYAPSGGNLQPWQVHVLMGEGLQRFRRLMAPKIQAAPQGGPSEYAVYPPALKEPYRTRRFQVGESMFALVGIRREDKRARIEQFARNYDFFGAPVALFFLVDRIMGAPQWSDVGMLMQNIMLLARERGLETCPQEAWSVWHREVTEFLGTGPELMLFCGMALGYGDYAAPINRLRAERASVDEFATFRINA